MLDLAIALLVRELTRPAEAVRLARLAGRIAGLPERLRMRSRFRH